MEASAHRSRAREALRGNWVTAVLVCLVASLITGAGITPEININFEGGDPIQVTLPQQYQEFLQNVLGISLAVIMILAMVMAVVGLILGGVMELGKARYHMNLIDGAAARFEDLFCGFPQFLQALVMTLVRDLLIVLGSLLIVPGIILSFSYAMAPYILAEDPGCSGTDALRYSRRLMKGHKLDLAMLELSFIGWIILSLFTLGIGGLFLEPYMEAAKASFYRDICQPSQTCSVEF